MNTPLDHDPDFMGKINQNRTLSNALEIIPMIATLVGIAIKNDALITIGFSTWAFIYIGLGWFVFKRKEYTFGSVLFAVITGAIIACGVLAVGFQIMDWQGKMEMKMATVPMLGLGLIANTIWFFMYKKNGQELGFSRKMLIRLAGLLAILLYFN